MMEISVKDLRIGDYFANPLGAIGRIDDIRHVFSRDKDGNIEDDCYRVKLAYDEHGESYCWLDIDELRPIPITPEILEKNGFALVEVGDNGPATPKKNYKRYERWERKTMWRDITIWFDRITKKWCLHGLNSVNISYIHELQHAFEFCDKVDLDIVL